MRAFPVIRGVADDVDDLLDVVGALPRSATLCLRSRAVHDDAGDVGNVPRSPGVTPDVDRFARQVRQITEVMG